MEGLHALCSHIDFSSKKNGTISFVKCNIVLRVIYSAALYITPEITGNVANWSYFLEELLGMIVQQKRLIISDREFLSSFLTSVVSRSGCNDSILVPRNTERRYLRIFVICSVGI